MIHPKRYFKHLLATDWLLTRAFPQKSLHAIERKITSSETRHLGEIRFVIEIALSGRRLIRGQSARERALDVFSQLRMWDTEQRNAVLIYLLLADHSVEIVADRGINGKVGDSVWEKICQDMEIAFRNKHYEQGVMDGIDAVNHLLTQHFPAGAINKNELPDNVTILH